MKRQLVHNQGRQSPGLNAFQERSFCKIFPLRPASFERVSVADNAGAISSAKGDFATVFAVIDVDQGSSHNNFVNKGTQNNASLDGSITGNSGNVGYNGQAGQGNQGKNNLAITTADGKNIAAASNTEQNSLNNSYLNTAASSHGYGKPQYVSNNASLDNSVNRNSGNVGVNLQSGAGNQGSNSLSIGQGCSVCASGVRF